MKYVRRTLLSIFLCFSLIHCSDTPKPEKPVITELKGYEEKISADRILDEIPPHIQEVENVAVFPADSEPLYSLELIPEQKFGSINDVYPLSILGVTFDDREKVIILSTGANYEQFLHVFNADGTYHTQLGRRGRGPGEYLTVLNLEARAKKIFALDYGNKRLNEYSSEDYTIIRSVLLENWKGGDGWRFGYVEPRSDGKYLVIFNNPRDRFGRQHVKFQIMDDEGKVLSKEPLIFRDGFRIKVGQSIRPTMPLTFLGRTIMTLSHGDILHTAWTRDFLIKKYDTRGEYQSAIYYPIKGLPFNLDEYRKKKVFSPRVGDIKNAFSDMDQKFPETFPVVDQLMVDDENRIWVEVPSRTEDINNRWWILDESGKLLAKLSVPQDKRILDIKDGYLYIREKDEDAETEYLMKYRIKLTEK